jgi:hypothetical protein
MSTPHQAVAEWHAAALEAQKRASVYEPDMLPLRDGRGAFAGEYTCVAAEVAALNATLCGIGALLVEGIELLKAATERNG